MKKSTIRSLCLYGNLGVCLTGLCPLISRADVSPVNTSAVQEVKPQETPKIDLKNSFKSKAEHVLVEAQRRERLEVKSGGELGVLGNVKGLDAPFSVHSYNDSLMANQQAQTIGQVLESDPSVRTSYGYGNFSEIFVIRGMPLVSDDVAIDGLYGLSPRQMVSPQLYSSVELLNGASGFLLGSAPGGTAIGGVVNVKFKKATSTPINRLTGDYTSGSMGGGSWDVGRRFGVNKNFGIRFNINGLDGETAIHHEYRHSIALGLNLDWHDNSNKTRVSANFGYQNQYVKGGRPALMLGGVTGTPKAVKASSNYGQDWNYTDLNYEFGMIKVERDLMKNMTAHLSFGGLNGDEKGNYSTTTLTNSQTGAAMVSAMYVPLVQTNETIQGGLNWKFNTPFIKHNVNLGAQSLWETERTAYAFGGQYPQTNIYSPQQSTMPAENSVGGNVKHPTKSTYENLYSVYFADTMSFLDDRIQLTGGFRYQAINNRGYNYAGDGSRTSSQDASAITPVVTLVGHIDKHTSFFFNRIEGLQQGPAKTGIGQSGYFSPYRTVQYETGLKYDTGTFNAGVSFFRVEVPQVIQTPIGNTGQYRSSETGMQRNQGIDFTINGRIIPSYAGLRFNGGASFIQTKQYGNGLRAAGGYSPGGFGASSVAGNQAVGVPDYTINGNIEWDAPYVKGLTFTGGVIHTGAQYADTANKLRVPSWTVGNIGARYTFSAAKKPITARFGVDNITNENYWSSAMGGYLMMGMPRTFMFSMSMDL